MGRTCSNLVKGMARMDRNFIMRGLGNGLGLAGALVGIVRPPCIAMGPMSKRHPLNCLITGGAGFVGSHLAERLLEEGHRVTSLDTLSTGAAHNIQHLDANPRFQTQLGSVLDETELAPLVEEADCIFHLAASVGVRFALENLVETLENNVRGTENVLRLAQRHGGKKVVLTSTSEVYGKSASDPVPGRRRPELGTHHVGPLGIRLFQNDG